MRLTAALNSLHYYGVFGLAHMDTVNLLVFYNIKQLWRTHIKSMMFHLNIYLYLALLEVILLGIFFSEAAIPNAM